MSEGTPDLAHRAMIRRKREDAAFVLPLLGVVLLASPLLNVFIGLKTVFGLPAIYAYVFLVWAGLTLLTRTLARRLAPDVPPDR
ncbi:MAG: hypothetical protein AAF813_00170 [Pseudomonadota bacterium]